MGFREIVQRSIATKTCVGRNGRGDNEYHGRQLERPTTAQYRQGDVLLVSEPQLPAGVTPASEIVDQGPLLLADGANDRDHVLQASPDVRAFRTNSFGGLVDWLEVRNAPVMLTHPQHAPVWLPSAIWRVVRQRRYDPATSWERSYARVWD
jgi:hypothetical protein